MYRSKNYKIGFIFIFLFFSSGFLLAQEEEKSDCLLKLEEAQNKFDQGRIQDIEPLIGQCLNGDEFEEAEKTQALRLLTLAYLYLEEPELAENTMLRLLQNSHEFAINEAIDPSEFINLHAKYRTAPLFSVGFLAGGVVTSPIVTQLNSTRDLNNDARQSYTPLIGFRIALMGEYKLMDKVYANAGFGYKSIKFQKNTELINVVSGTVGGGFEGVETQTSIELPLIVRYHVIETKQLKPYVGLGVVPQFLLNASYPGEFLKNEIQGSAAATSQTIELKEDRNRFNLNAVITAGIKLKVGEGYLNAQIRYSYGIFKYSTEEAALAPSNPDLLWDLNDSSDGYRLHDLGISIGYTNHRYIPKKLR